MTVATRLAMRLAVKCNCMPSFIQPAARIICLAWMHARNQKPRLRKLRTLVPDRRMRAAQLS
jgi:hypothetical protein